MKSAPANNPWFVYFKRNPYARLRLFCLPYAGGSASIFLDWPDQLPDSVEMCAIQLPGRGGRLLEPAYTRVEPLIQVLSQALLPSLDKPFALFGHSLGALLGFELANHLRREYDLEPCNLFVSGRRAPQIPDDDPPIHNLPEAEMIEELIRLNGTPREVLEHPELMQLMLPVLRADFGLNELYSYQQVPPLNYPITAFGGLQDADVSYEQLDAWREHARGRFSLQMLGGDHFFIETDQQALLGLISRELNQTIESFCLSR